MEQKDVARFWQTRLARAVVSIELEPSQLREWYYGTGFFVTPQYVLSAGHNTESESQPVNKKGIFKATFRDQRGRSHVLSLRWIEKLSSPKCEHDIAVLRLEGSPPPDLEPLNASLLLADGLTTENVEFLKGRPVVLFGYPVGDKGVEGRLVSGQLYDKQPLKPHTLRNSGTGKLDVQSSTLELVVVGENAHELPGISGAPIVDIESKTVIGVQHSYVARDSGPRAGTHFVYGSPMNLIVERWPDFPSACDARRLKLPATEPEEYSQKIRLKLKELLRALEGKTIEHHGIPMPVLEYLARELVSESHAQQVNPVDRLAELLSGPEKKIRRSLREAVKKSTGESRQGITTQIGHIIDLIFPLQIPPELWDRLRCDRQIRTRLGKAAGLITAEAVAAREAGAPMNIEHGSDGKLSAPFLGGQPSLQGVPGALSGPFDSFVKDLWNATGFGEMPPDVPRMIAQLKGFYRSWEEDHERPPYVFVELPQNADDREAWLRALVDFGEKVEHVLIIEKCGDLEFHVLEGELMGAWQNLHPKYVLQRD
jgi:hypothetical protein